MTGADTVPIETVPGPVPVWFEAFERRRKTLRSGRTLAIAILMTLMATRAVCSEPDATGAREYHIFVLRYVSAKTVRTLAGVLYPTLRCAVDDTDRFLYVQGPRDHILAFKKFVSEVDYPPGPHLLIDVHLYSVNARGAQTLQLVNTDSFFHVRAVTFRDQIPRYEEWVGSAEFVGAPFVSSDNLSATVARGDAKIIATSRRETENGGQNYIRFEDRMPTTYFDSMSNVMRVKLFVAGLSVSVRATVNQSAQWVDCRVLTEFSISSTGSPGDFQNFLRVLDTPVETRLKSGETMYLCGPKPNFDLMIMPILKTLPIFGKLFSDDNSTYLLISVTPRILP